MFGGLRFRDFGFGGFRVKDVEFRVWGLRQKACLLSRVQSAG